jgi:hypothetical protein
MCSIIQIDLNNQTQSIGPHIMAERGVRPKVKVTNSVCGIGREPSFVTFTFGLTPLPDPILTALEAIET